jgi:hypothetical protein
MSVTLASGTIASVLSVTVIVRDAKSCAKSTPENNDKASHLDMDYT